MTDRKILEMAAKAAGEVTESWYGNEAYLDGVLSRWNPLTNDGDALRLAVVLGMVVNTREGISTASVGRHTCCVEPHGSDPYESTRRAIVRAAAEIGKNMK